MDVRHRKRKRLHRMKRTIVGDSRVAAALEESQLPKGLVCCSYLHTELKEQDLFQPFIY